MQTEIAIAPSAAGANHALQPVALAPLRERPLVSILVSNYNYGKYIQETIESALEQTYSNFELVLCDDGSTDNSVEIVERYAQRDARVRLIRKVNGGQATGFNAAFAASRGEILCLLDSDDVYLPQKVQRVVEGFQASADCGFAVHRVIRVSEERKRQGVWPMSNSLPAGWHGSRLLENGGVLAYMPPTSGLSLRREVAERIFPLPTDRTLLCCADQMITRIAPLLTPVMRQEEAMAEYRLHTSNNYERSRVSADSLRRELTACDQLWNAQQVFLRALDAEIATRFQPVSTHPYITYLEYLHSRFAGDPQARRFYIRYLKSIQDIPDVRYLWFWKLSLWLPRPVFSFAINLMNRQSSLKQFIARLRRLV